MPSMPKHHRQNLKKITGIAAVITVTAAVFAFLPMPYTLYTQPNDGLLTPGDMISEQIPLEQCVTGDFADVTGIDLLLATYGRTNSNLNYVEIFTLQNDPKNVLFKQEFSSPMVRDNDFFSINFPAIESAGRLCFFLESYEATPQNGITYWMNSQSQPVLKLRSTKPLYKAVEKIHDASRFDLPIWLVIALCLLYISATVTAIFFIWHETNHVPKTALPHPRRTRKK